jgi:hypothetical protein
MGLTPLGSGGSQMTTPVPTQLNEYEKVIAEIVEILRLDGEEVTDGQCLDLIIKLLGKHGWKVFS